MLDTVQAPPVLPWLKVFGDLLRREANLFCIFLFRFVLQIKIQRHFVK